MTPAEEDALKALVDKMAADSGYGGIGMGTMYGDFALDVARAAVEIERERAANMAEYIQVEEREGFGPFSIAQRQTCQIIAHLIRKGEA